MKYQKINFLFISASILVFFSLACKPKGTGYNIDNNAADNTNISATANDEIEILKVETWDTEIPLFEAYPQWRLESLEAEERDLEKIKDDVDDKSLNSFISVQTIWKKKVVTVAFNGGSNELRRNIEETVKAWTSVANIRLEFRDPARPAEYRQWATSNSGYSADIRIAFDAVNPATRYWSAVGEESISFSDFPPNEPSMNLGFPQQLPRNWQSKVLHEFGHALGFRHELQSPDSICEEELRWEDDPGYIKTPPDSKTEPLVPDKQGRKPGIYTILGGFPNFWSIPRINANVRKLPRDNDKWKVSPFDKDSIMKYNFESWMYKDTSVSQKSGCHSPFENLTLSAQDKIAATGTYPFDLADIQKVNNERIEISTRFLNLKNIPNKLKEKIRANIRAMKNRK